jgi:DNA polymerase III alpha subunit/nucleotidyltransferase/DNA polymerase involved in DNA repair
MILPRHDSVSFSLCVSPRLSAFSALNLLLDLRPQVFLNQNSKIENFPVSFPRSIVHLDADAFFASVEQAADARLRGKPIAVGGEKRGIIASASYEARKFGIYTPMPSAMARRLCPKLILLPGDFEKYELFSRLMFSYAYDFTPDVEIGSIDEGYFDLTGVRKPAMDIAGTIRNAIRQSLKLPVSEGIGSNKLISQIASKFKKPFAFEFVPHGHEAEFLCPLANKWLPGIGPKTATQLNAAGLARIGQIARTPPDLLGLLVGSFAPQLRNFALGIDERPIIPVRAPAKSYGEQETFAADTTDEPFLEATLRRMADKLMAKVRDDGKSIRTLTVKVRYNDMDEEQASESLEEPTDLETETYSKISALFHKAWKRRVSLRLVSLKLSNVYNGSFRAGLGLDISARQHDAQQRLAVVVDELRQKFGRAALLRGHDFILREKFHSPESRVHSRLKAVQSSKFKVQSPCRSSSASVRLPSAKHAIRNTQHAPGSTFHVSRFSSLPPPPAFSQSKIENQKSKISSAIIQRQRIGNSFVRVLPKPSHSPAPELRFRTGPTAALPPPASSQSKIKNQKSKISSVPLNLHSYYSFLDSTLSIQAIIDLALQHELPAIALTDKNNLHGAVEFAQAAAQAGIKPILGAEIDYHGHPVCLYVQNQTGYQNLCRILNRVNQKTTDNSKSEIRNLKPETISKEEISNARNSIHTPVLNISDSDFGFRISDFPTEGLLAVSPSPTLAPLFPDRFYLTIDNLDVLEKHHSALCTLHSALPLVASFPIHYALPSDRWKYEIVQSIRTLSLLRQAHPEKRFGGQYHFRTPTEMQRLFSAHPELFAHSLEIADRCSFAFSLGTPQFPGYSPPKGLTPAAFLRRLVMDGLRRRYPNDHEHLKPQLEQELAIITDVGYEEYFLVMWDILQECRRHGIDWITRGSAADSLACYCLEISSVCPIRFDLYFRRFLNKDRMALNKLPDIDVDFPHDRKDDVIDLIFKRFGPECTAIVGGFSTFQSRSAFAEVAKVLGVSEFQVRRITERLPHFSRAGELAEATAASLECRDLPLDQEPYSTALQMAYFLDGFPRYPKMHPCGLVLSRQPMHELTPCFTSAKGYPTTHFDMDSVEAIGLIKMDILAQGGLAVMRDVEEMLSNAEVQSSKSKVQSQNLESQDPEFRANVWTAGNSPAFVRDNAFESTGAKFECQIENRKSKIKNPLGLPTPLGPFDDPAVWSLISSGQARAVHHIESPAMISLCKMCNVRDIDTLIAIVSVIRPGAANESKKMEFARRYQGLSPVHYPHPSLERCLQSTFGLVVYEEHILQICEAFAGLPPGRADILRRALAKEKADVIAQIKTEFADCARKLGRTDAKIAEVWDLVTGFRGYAFCKAHSTAYGVEAYQSAWLKLRYPAEFMAAVLTNGKGFYSPLVYVLECHRLGIPLLPPFVNEPGPQFTIARNEPADLSAISNSQFTNKIRVPLLQLKGLTTRTADTILAERAHAPFSSLTDFFLRVRPLPEEIDSLIRVGTFDPFGQTRTTQYWHFKSIVESGVRGVESKKQISSFNVGCSTLDVRRSAVTQPAATQQHQLWLLPPTDLNRLPSVPLTEPTPLDRLRAEEELLGYPVSGHPLDLFPDIAWDTYCPVNRLGEHIGERIVTCGLVIEQRLFHQATGEPMKFITIADRTGIIETELFAKTYQSYGLNTVRYRVLEITATVEPFENGRGHTLRVIRAEKPRTRNEIKLKQADS